MMQTFHEYDIDVSESRTGNVKTTCPECSALRKKSNDKCLSVNVDEGVWLCHHCGWSGHLNGREDVPQRKPFRKAKDFTLKPSWVVSEKALQWFKGRHIHEDTLRQANISSGKKFMPQVEKEVTVIAFPYYLDGQLVNVKYRDGAKNFIQEKDAVKCFWRQDSINPDEPIIITEGEMDALTWMECGYTNVMSVPDGAPSPQTKNYEAKFSFLEPAKELLDAAETVIIAVDADPPGRTLESELARRIGKGKCWRVEYPEECKDINQVLTRHGADEVLKVLDRAQRFPIEGLHTTTDLLHGALRIYRGETEEALSTGWEVLDEHYKIRPQEMSIVTGYPGSGKSTWMDALTVQLHQNHGWRFVYCSPEQLPLEYHMLNIVKRYEGKPWKPGPTPRMSEEELKQAVQKLQGAFNFVLLEDFQMNPEKILEITESAIYRHGIKGLVLDPWNELDHSWNESEHQYISQSLTRIRRFARLHDIHIWIVAHPKKPSRDKKTGQYNPPTLYDISGSATWYDKADNGLSLFRPSKTSDRVDVFVQKIRFQEEIGRPGRATLLFNRETATYISAVDYTEEES